MNHWRGARIGRQFWRRATSTFHCSLDGWMDGWMDERKEGEMNQQMDGPEGIHPPIYLRNIY